MTVLTSRIVIGLSFALASASAVVSGCSDSDGSPEGSAGSPMAIGGASGGNDTGAGAAPSEVGGNASNEGGASGVGNGGAVNDGGAEQGSGGGGGVGATGGAGDAGSAGAPSEETGGGAGETSVGGAGGGGNALQCAVGAGSDGKIDDFEDNDLSSHAGDGRKSAVWQAYNDAVLSLHSAGGYLGCEVTSNQQACGVTLHPDCYDATKYNGIKLVARGKGTFLLALKTPDTTPISEAGRCVEPEKGDQLCGDHFRVVLDELEEDFSTLILPWSKFEQGSWGVPAPEGLRKDELMSVVLGADFWPETSGEATLEISSVELY